MSQRLGEIPWSRLATCEGRATPVQQWLQQVESEDRPTREKAITALVRNLTCQDGVCQAAAYAVPFLLRQLKSQVRGVQEGALTVSARLIEASTSRPPGGRLELSGHTLDTPVLLLPEFVSEEDDEALWEEVEESIENWRLWQDLTADGFYRERDLLRSLDGVVGHTKKLVGLLTVWGLREIEPS